MNIGIIVEGERDSAVYPELIRKIRDDTETVYPISCGDVARLKTRFVAWLRHFEWHAGLSVDKVLVIMDSDCSNPSIWEAQLRRIYEQSRFVPSFPVHFHATKCEIETWLLTDENAVNQVSRHRGKNKQARAVTIQFESYRNARELFHKMLSQTGLPANARVYEEIASAVNIERIAARCPHFQEFVAKVRAC